MTNRLHLLAVLGLLALLPLTGCKEKTADKMSDKSRHDHAAMDGGKDEPLYQCAMHPNVVADKPGLCPICGMELQKVKKIDAKGIPGRSPVQLTDQQKQLINLRTVPVTEGPVQQSIRARGIIHHDSSKVFTISAWTAGRIERLYVDEEEMFVSEGEKLYGIYSPELFSTVQDYLLLRKGNSSASLVESARTRLRQKGLTDDVIAGLRTADAALTIDVPSPAKGLVMKKMIRLGDYVKEGDPLYTIVDLSELWLMIDVYESELPFIEPGQEVTATTPAVPDKVFAGVVELVNHQIDPSTRTAQVRVVISDASQYMETTTGADGNMRHQHLLMPEMWMNAEIERDLGEQLTVPASAIFDTGKQQYVFYEQSEGIFVPALVELGPKLEERQVIRSGVNAGDAVVVDGNFLLDSESQLKAAASGPMAEAPKEMGEMDMAGMDMNPKHPLPESAAGAAGKLLTSYEKMRGILAQDSTEGIAPAAEQMKAALAQLRSPQLMPVEAEDVYEQKLVELERSMAAQPPDLESAREQFGTISAAVIDLFKAFPPPLDQLLQVVNCPMWTKSAANWLQVEKEIQNPFMGQQMLRCGEVKSTIEGAK